jgi:hypothetical protein
MDKLTISQFLSFLQKRQIRIGAKDGRLQIKAPAGAIDSQLHAELLRRKPDLLAFLEASSSYQPLTPRGTDSGRIPQTPAQQGLWLINHHDPGNVTYNIAEAFLVETEVDRVAIQKSINQLLVRHPILRTGFYEEDGDLFQSISEEAEADVEFIDLSVFPEQERDQRLRDMISEQARRPFDLKRPPLLRFVLFRLHKQRHALYWCIHHIVADRKSLDVLLEELIALYQAATGSEPASLPDNSLQYADYAFWLAKRMNSDAIEKQIRYWKRKLTGAPPFLELPHTRPYPKQRTSWGAALPLTIPDSLRKSLDRLGLEEHATPFITFLAALALLLHLSSGAEDFCIGSPITNRTDVATERMIGLFVNMLTFRCQLTPEHTFREMIRRVRDTAIEAYDNSEVPFQKLVRAIKPDRRSARSPIFQVMFGFESYQPTTGALRQINTNPGTARYDLTLNLLEKGRETVGSFEYCTDIFDESDIKNLIEKFAIVLKIAEQPDRPISSFQLDGVSWD